MFAEYAQKYWDAGLPVMPLRPQSKIPVLSSWQNYSIDMPDEDTRKRWLEAYPDGNMGLPMGPKAGLVAVDLDTDDPRVIKVLEAILPVTPWERVGKKGSIRVYRYTGERTFRVKDSEGKTLVEVLSKSTQIVLPPSIHPDTKRPYEANANLWEVLDKVVPLPPLFETLLRKQLIDAGIELQGHGSAKVAEWVPAGGRDSALVSNAGILARAVVRGERTLLEALAEIEMWVAAYTEKVVGDPTDPEKGKQKVMEFVRRDIVEHNRQLPIGWDAGMTTEEVTECKTYFGEDIEEWTQKQLMDHLHEQFSVLPREDLTARTKVVDEVLTRLARSKSLTQLDHDVVLQFIQNANGRMVTMSALRKRLKELEGTDITGNDHTEVAQHLIKEIEKYGELRFHAGHFYQWKGSHWEQQDSSALLKVLAEEFGNLAAARRHSDHRGILNTCENLVRADLVEDSTVGINFANGFLTMDLQLRDHDPKYGATYCLPYRYLPEEGAPLRFLSFLDHCWGNDEDYTDKVKVVRQMIAAMLFGQGPKYSRVMCFFGPPHTGKTTLMDIVMGLVPTDTRCAVPPHEWGDRFMPAQMAGKLFNQCGELSETQMIDGSKFKSIVEGGEMSGQHKGQNIFMFRPKCMHFFATNHLPRTRDTSAGFNRRWLFLHFTNVVKQEDKRKDLAEDILADEREAIVAWAIPAIQELQEQQEFTIPSSHKTLISEVASQNNSVRFFLTSGPVVVQSGPDAGGLNRMSEKELYSLYYAFCRTTANAQPVQLKRFRFVMQELQGEFGFLLLIEHSGMAEEAWYTNLTPARKTGAGALKSA